MFGHGTVDPVVGKHLGEASHNLLVKAGFSSEFNEYRGVQVNQPFDPITAHSNIDQFSIRLARKNLATSKIFSTKFFPNRGLESEFSLGIYRPGTRFTCPVSRATLHRPLIGISSMSSAPLKECHLSVLNS